MWLIESIFCGIYGYVMANILTEPGMILNRLYVFMKKFPEWIVKPTVGCSYCVAGQAALWVYLIRNYSHYDFLSHVFFIIIAIFSVEVINSTITKLNK